MFTQDHEKRFDMSIDYNLERARKHIKFIEITTGILLDNKQNDFMISVLNDLQMELNSIESAMMSDKAKAFDLYINNDERFEKFKHIVVNRHKKVSEINDLVCQGLKMLGFVPRKDF